MIGSLPLGSIETRESRLLIQDQFYRGFFDQCVEWAEKLKKISAARDDLEHQRDSLAGMLIKAASWMELHKIQASREILNLASDLIHQLNESSAVDLYPLREATVYLTAILDLRDGRTFLAMEQFDSIISQCLDFSERHSTARQELGTLAAIASANAAVALGEFQKAEVLISQLHQLEPFEKTCIRLEFLMLLANYSFQVNSDLNLALSYGKKAYSQAAKHSWSFYTNRALLQIALIHQHQDSGEALWCTLDFLNLNLEDSQYRYLVFLANKQFKDELVVKTLIEFDSKNKRIYIGSSWIALHDRPILFDFLTLLHDREDFLDKRTIAETLWPHEPYKPRVHDPRIFDIAKRVRSLIETYRSQPVTLLSGRTGYKLASF